MFEPRDVARFRRDLAAMTRRAGADDPEALAQIVELLNEAMTVGVPAAVAQLRSDEGKGPAGGYSWAAIAAPLGITRATAHERFSPTGRKAAGK